mmetsp:Transcript_29348/g.54953  ORF Transcript_29348/g.54953 Transcript_29348/m.54953 type:complete len:264 (-) Transcript_29348:6-797(-)
MDKRHLASVSYSLAVSVKMNIFLFAPGLFLVLLSKSRLTGSIYYISICAMVQLAVGLPFLVTHPINYIKQSFNLARTFNHYWSVNFKWVPCQPLAPDQKTLLNDCAGIFTSKPFGLGLLLATVVLWLVYAAHCAASDRREAFLSKASRFASFDGNEIATVMLVSNFIGVAFSRSLHFQFYVWYFHALPFLLWCTRLPVVLKMVVLLGIEMCWNPWEGETSTVASSMLLTSLHALLLIALAHGLWVGRSRGSTWKAAQKDTKLD